MSGLFSKRAPSIARPRAGASAAGAVRQSVCPIPSPGASRRGASVVAFESPIPRSAGRFLDVARRQRDPCMEPSRVLCGGSPAISPEDTGGIQPRLAVRPFSTCQCVNCAMPGQDRATDRVGAGNHRPPALLGHRPGVDRRSFTLSILYPNARPIGEQLSVTPSPPAL